VRRRSSKAALEASLRPCCGDTARLSLGTTPRQGGRAPINAGQFLSRCRHCRHCSNQHPDEHARNACHAADGHLAAAVCNRRAGRRRRPLWMHYSSKEQTLPARLVTSREAECVRTRIVIARQHTGSTSRSAAVRFFGSSVIHARERPLLFTRAGADCRLRARFRPRSFSAAVTINTVR
jgi:hypothetical protein